MLNNQVLNERHSMVGIFFFYERRQNCAHSESSCPFIFRLLNFRFHMRLIYHKSIHFFFSTRAPHVFKGEAKRRNITLHDISSTPLLSAQKYNVKNSVLLFLLQNSSLAYSLLNFMSLSVCFFFLPFFNRLLMSLGGKWTVNRQ